MNDERLEAIWAALEPDAGTVRRIDGRVLSWLEARDTSLATEWLGLFRVSPVAALGLVSVSAVAIVVATPLLWVARALL